MYAPSATCTLRTAVVDDSTGCRLVDWGSIDDVADGRSGHRSRRTAIAGEAGHGLDADAADAVHSFVVPERRFLAFSTCDVGTLFDTTLCLKRACLETADVACSTGDSTCLVAPRRATLSVGLDPGLYYLVVDGGGAAGSDCVHHAGR